MADPLDRVYSKTDLARSELEARSRRLLGTARTVLILVDGRSSVRALNARLGYDAGPVLADLLASGYVGAVEPPRPPPRRIDPPPMPPPPPPPPPPLPPAEDLTRARGAALVRLAPHFGPDVEIVARPLLEAADRTAFNAGLDQIERKLAVYMGRAQAARTVADLRL